MYTLYIKTDYSNLTIAYSETEHSSLCDSIGQDH